jgi:hypothetical protein
MWASLQMPVAVALTTSMSFMTRLPFPACGYEAIALHQLPVCEPDLLSAARFRVEFLRGTVRDWPTTSIAPNHQQQPPYT